MTRRAAVFFLVLVYACSAFPQTAQPKFHVLAFYTEKTEADHVDFARQAVTFFEADAKRDNFDWHVTTNWNDLNAENLQHYQLVVWLNDSPQQPAQRQVFQQYMEHG